MAIGKSLSSKEVLSSFTVIGYIQPAENPIRKLARYSTVMRGKVAETNDVTATPNKERKSKRFAEIRSANVPEGIWIRI